MDMLGSEPGISGVRHGSEVLNYPEANLSADVAAASGSNSIERFREAIELEITHLAQQCAEIEKRISVTQATIRGLFALFDKEAQTEQSSPTGRVRRRRSGLTAMCRRVLKEAASACFATEVASLIHQRDPSLLEHHKNSTASVTTILSRLAKNGEIRVISSVIGRSRWQWIDHASHEDQPGSSRTR
jgi:hypothetical protein